MAPGGNITPSWTPMNYMFLNVPFIFSNWTSVPAGITLTLKKESFLLADAGVT